ncbi:MAG: efflux RND transporter permease subunit [Bacteroidales bacterium]
MVIDDVGDVFGMFYALVADDGFSYEEMSDYAGFLERNMLEVEGVKKVSIYGEQSPEIRITLSADRMAEMGVLPFQVFSALTGHTKQLYAGSLVSGEQQLRVNVDGQLSTVEELRNLLITPLGGVPFTLGDIARIEKGYNDPLRNTLFVDNQKALGLAMSMESGENIVEVGKRVDARLSELESQIPLGIRLVKVFNQPEKVDASIHGFTWNLVFSVLIVIVVLIFTMGFRGGLIIGSGLLLTILATFPMLLLVGGTLQRISLGAFIVAMGMLVDNAIVVLDGILVEKGRGRTGKKVFTKTARQTAVPLLGATLIAVTAFLPVYLSPDAAGTYVRDLFLVLAISLSISWLLALTQVPLFSSILLRKQNGVLSGTGDRSGKPLYRFFGRILEAGMHNRGLTLGIAVALLVLVVLNVKRVDNTFFPNFDYNQFYIEHSLPKGSTPDLVNANLRKITDHFNSYEEVELVVASHGRTPVRYCLVRGMMGENADNYGELIVNFKDYETMQKMRPVFSQYLHTEFPEAHSRIRNYTLSVRSSHAVEAEFTGPDPAVLKELSRQVQVLMLENPHADVYTRCDDWEPEARTLTALYDPVAGNRASVTRSDVSNAILAATDGLPLATVYDGETPYTLRFLVRNRDGNRIEDLNDIPVWPTIPNLGVEWDQNTLMGLMAGRTDAGDLAGDILTAVPLRTVTGGVVLGWEEPVVRRRNGQRVIQAQCDPVPGVSPAQLQNELDKHVSKLDLPEGYGFRWVGESELKHDGLKNIIGLTPLAGGIMVLILLLLFNDYRRPLIILLCLPMSVIGIVPGLLLTGEPFSFIAIVGVIGLTGMIIKNAIVLLDEIATQLKKGQSAYRAVVRATVSRVRPVIMASLTTILGMIPLLGDPMYASMAVAIIGGLLVGTLVTLLFVPILYSVFYGVAIENPSEEIEPLSSPLSK